MGPVGIKYECDLTTFVETGHHTNSTRLNELKIYCYMVILMWNNWQPNSEMIIYVHFGIPVRNDTMQFCPRLNMWHTCTY